MVKINFDQVLKDLDGTPIKEPPKSPEDNTPANERPDLTLKTVCVKALVITMPNEKVSGEEKLERWENAQILQKGGEINFTIETLGKFKKLIAEYWGTAVSGQAWQMLEKAKAEEETEKKKGEKNR